MMRKSKLFKITNAIIILIIAAYIVSAQFSIFIVQNISMEKTLYSGDIVLVLNKNMNFFNKRYNLFRVKRNDILIFHKLDTTIFRIEPHFYIKRCVGIPNDIIKNKSYIVKNNANNIFYKDGLFCTKVNTKRNNQEISQENPAQIRFVDSISLRYWEYPRINSFSKIQNHFWTTLQASKISKDINSPIFESSFIAFKDSSSVLNNISSSIIQKDYFFLLGDNINHSQDSRHWGCISEENIYGKAIIVICSIDGSFNGEIAFKKKRFFLNI